MTVVHGAIRIERKSFTARPITRQSKVSAIRNPRRGTRNTPNYNTASSVVDGRLVIVRRPLVKTRFSENKNGTAKPRPETVISIKRHCKIIKTVRLAVTVSSLCHGKMSKTLFRKVIF